MSKAVVASINKAVAPPAEESAAQRLRTAFEAFHAKAPKRERLTAAEQRELDAVVELATAYATAAREEWVKTKEWGTDTPPPVVQQLSARVEAYAEVTAGTVSLNITAGDGVVTVHEPAISSAAVREHLTTEGAAVLGMIDDAIAAGYARVASTDAAVRRYEGNVMELFRATPAGQMLFRTLLLLEDDDPERYGGEGPRDAIVDDVVRTLLSFTDKVRRQMQVEDVVYPDYRKALSVVRRLVVTDNNNDGPQRGAA